VDEGIGDILGCFAEGLATPVGGKTNLFGGPLARRRAATCNVCPLAPTGTPCYGPLAPIIPLFLVKSKYRFLIIFNKHKAVC
jgi:hypothetical protein